MASNSFKVLLQILGDASGAVGAVGKVGQSLERLGKDFQAATQAADQLGAKVNRAVQNAQGGLNRLMAGARQAASVVKQAFAGAPSLNFSAILQNISSGLSKLSGSAKNFKAALASAIASAGKLTSMGGLVSTLTSAWNRAILAVKQYIVVAALAKGAITARLNLPSLTGIASGVSAFTTGLKSAAANVISLAGRVASFGSTATKAFMTATGKVLGFTAALASAAALGATKLASSLTSGLSKFSGFLNNLRAQLMNINDVLRYASQGLTNVGRSLMFFISLPVGAFLGKTVNDAINFQDALVRVQKTTELADQDLVWLTEHLRDLARNTATSHVELAGIAEVIGQMGVTSKEAIFNLTQIFDMFAVATDQTGADVATSLGRIANAFGWNLNAASDDVERLANVINELENSTAASASEIMGALADFAPFANMLGISAANAAGFAATLVSVGLSADEAGTALRNMSLYVARNAEEVSAALSSFSSDYASAESVIQALDRDAVKVFLDILTAASQSNEEVQRMLTLMEIGDMRGGRGMAAMAGNVQMLRDNLAAANAEWERHTSLLVEYNRALTSTKSQMGMLKNNITDLGITIGDTLLPVINEIIQVAVPAIQMLSVYFKQLPKHTQMMVVGLTAAGLLLGPLLMFLGQMLHAVTLLFLGFGQFLRFLVFMTAGLGKLGGVVVSVGRYFLSWPGLVLAAVVGVLKVLSMLGVNIAGLFKKLADSARSWGENLAKNIASGLLAGAVRFITRVISWIANLIAGFFESHSPPKQGPLATIDRWGIALMETFLRGFKEADFSILSDVSRIIEKILTSGLDDARMPKALKKLAAAREKLAELIAKFNQTGVIDEDLLSQATQGLGEMAGKVQELVRLSLRYNQIQERLAKLEADRKQVLKTYDAEIAAIGASNMSVTDKVAAIRAAQRARDNGLRGVDKEKDALEEQAALIKAQLDFQRQMIDALQEQEDIFTRIADILKRLAEQKAGADGGAGGMGDLDLGGLGAGIEDAQEKFKQATEQVRNVIQRFEEGKQKLQGFLDAWNGLAPLPRDAFATDEIYNSYMALYKFGQRVADVRDWFLKLKDSASQALSAVRDLFKGGIGGGGNIFDSLKNIDWKNLPVIGDFLKGLKAGFDPKVIDALKGGWETLKQGWQDFLAVFQDKGVQEAGRTIGWLLGMLARGIGWLLGFLISALGTVLGYIGAFLAWLWGWGFKIEAWAIKVGAALINWFTALPQTISNALSAIRAWWENLKATIAQKWQDIKQSTVNAWNGLKASIANAIGGVKTTITNKINGIVSAVKAKWEEIKANAARAWEAIKTAIAEKVDGLLNYFGITGQIRERWAQIWADVQLITSTVWQRIVATASTWIAVLATTIRSWLDALKAWWSEQWTYLVTVLTTIWNQIVAAIMTALTRAYQSMVTVLGMAKAWWQGVWQSFLAFILPIWNSIKTTVTEAVTTVYNTAVQWFTSLKTKVEEIWNAVVTTVTTVWASIVSSVTAKVQEVYQAVIDKIEEIKTWIGNQVQAFVQLASDLIQGLIDGIHNMASSLVQSATSAAESLITAIKQALGIASPSTIFFSIGIDLIQGLIDGISSLLNGLGSIIGQVASTILDGMKNLFGGGQNQESMNIEDLLPSEQEVASRLAGIEQAITRFLSGLESDWTKTGNSLETAWEGLWSSVTQKVQAASSALQPFVTAVTKAWENLTRGMRTVWDALWLSIERTVNSFTSKISFELTRLYETVSIAATTAKTKVELLKTAIDRLKAAIDLARTAIENFKSSLAGLSTGKIDSVKSSWSKVTGAIDSATKSLQAFINKLSALQNTTIRTTVVASGSGAAARGGFSGKSGTSSLSGNWSGSVTPHASGGHAGVGQAYMVGELGEELFIPDQGGTIVPNHLMKRAFMSGFGGVEIGNIEVNINSPIVRDDLDIRRLADLVAQELSKSLYNRLKFGGNITM